MVVTIGEVVVGAEAWVNARTRVFGWRMYRSVPEPREAEALRIAAEQVAAGMPLSVIATRWNTVDRVPNLRGGRWHAQSLEAVLRRKSNVPVLLNADLYKAVLTVLNDPERGRKWRDTLSSLQPPRPERASTRRKRGLPRTPKGRRVWLGSQLVVCSTCGATLRRTRSSANVAYLGCSAPNRGNLGGGYGHPTIEAQTAEDTLRQAIITAWGEEIGADEAEARFDLLSLANRRAIARRLLVATAVSVPGMHRGELRVTRRTTPSA